MLLKLLIIKYIQSYAFGEEIAKSKLNQPKYLNPDNIPHSFLTRFNITWKIFEFDS